MKQGSVCDVYLLEQVYNPRKPWWDIRSTKKLFKKTTWNCQNPTKSDKNWGEEDCVLFF